MDKLIKISFEIVLSSNLGLTCLDELYLENAQIARRSRLRGG